ncbi:MAG: hypothetical protein AAGE59_23320 [Cyanobacteria bacterium P01_F01_bin.86]
MTSPRKRFIRPLLARDRTESYRTATQLELFFDLVVVIAIAAAAPHDVNGALSFDKAEKSSSCDSTRELIVGDRRDLPNEQG